MRIMNIFCNATVIAFIQLHTLLKIHRRTDVTCRSYYTLRWLNHVMKYLFPSPDISYLALCFICSRAHMSLYYLLIKFITYCMCPAGIELPPRVYGEVCHLCFLFRSVSLILCSNEEGRPPQLEPFTRFLQVQENHLVSSQLFFWWKHTPTDSP